MHLSPLETVGFPFRGTKRPFRNNANLFRYYKLACADMCKSMKYTLIDLGLFRDHFVNW